MSLDGFTSVAVLAPLEQPLTYSIPDELKERLSPGQRVVVPLGRRKSVGVILGEEKNPPTMTCKPIESLLEEEPTFTQSQLEFLKWAADYYLVPIGEMLRVALPGALAKVKGSGKKKVTGYRLQGIATVDLESKNESRKLTLTESQRKIVETIFTKENESKFSVHLIHGITGSGKTEIYLECIRQRLQQGYQVISLVPEIGLTPQTLKRYTQYFEGKIGIYHSDLSENERARIWQACQKGEISILIGTRSALFAPFRNLGLIVIDEEQDSSYKQEERVRYHARDLAIVRAKIEKIPILLGSATPSVETYAKAQSGKFFYHTLSERFGNAELPKIEVVDLLKEKEKSPKKTSLLSTRLLEEIKINLDRQEQTLIFLNRRGFSHFLLCQDCGETPKCSNCDLTLTFHRRFKKLICHYCDYQMPPPDHCLKCSGGDWMPVGSGTERIEEELQSHFPQARIARMDRDTTTRRGAHQKILEKLARHEIDILVGTQMITKGHDYPLVTLVGILSADTALHHPDFRAAEETFQLITQVAGRAGRAQNPGRVLLQTYSPEHYSIQTATHHQVKEFYEQELAHREEVGYPPFQRLMVFRIQGTQQTKVKQSIEKLNDQLQSFKKSKKLSFQILGPSPCLIEKMRNLYRWQILIKYPPSFSLQSLVRQHLYGNRSQWLSTGLRLMVDVDPMRVI